MNFDSESEKMQAARMQTVNVKSEAKLKARVMALEARIAKLEGQADDKPKRGRPKKDAEETRQVRESSDEAGQE
jgi:hypothetical protein